jgi:GT2 family glycosyltransferase
MIKVSVIIPAWNVGSSIEPILAALNRNRSSAVEMEVILADNLSDDDTAVRAKKAGAIVVENETGQRVTIAELRNRGVEIATGDILAFLDADVIVTSDWLETVGRRFTQGFSGVIGCITTVSDEAGWVAKVWGMRMPSTGSREKKVDYLPGCNLVVSREAFDAVHGFDEQLTTNEDKDFTFQVAMAGYPVLQLPEPVLLHQGYEKGLREFIRKEFWRQSSTLEYARKHHFTQRTLRNPLMSAGHLLMIAGCFSCILSGAFVPALCFMLAWSAPSGIIAWKGGKVDIPLYRLRLFLLTFLRWNVAGAALLPQFIRTTYRNNR